jgi:hypothetical protein
MPREACAIASYYHRQKTAAPAWEFIQRRWILNVPSIWRPRDPQWRRAWALTTVAISIAVVGHMDTRRWDEQVFYFANLHVPPLS